MVVQVTQTNLPEAIYQDDYLDTLSRPPALAPATTQVDANAHNTKDDHGMPYIDRDEQLIVLAQQQGFGFPVSLSSSPRNPSSGWFHTYSLGMAMSMAAP